MRKGTPPMIRIAFVVVSAAALAACGTIGGPREDVVEQLRAECAERGGVLVATGNERTGQERAQWACRTSELPTRR